MCFICIYTNSVHFHGFCINTIQWIVKYSRYCMTVHACTCMTVHACTCMTVHVHVYMYIIIFYKLPIPRGAVVGKTLTLVLKVILS